MSAMFFRRTSGLGTPPSGRSPTLQSRSSQRSSSQRSPSQRSPSQRSTSFNRSPSLSRQRSSSGSTRASRQARLSTNELIPEEAEPLFAPDPHVALDIPAHLVPPSQPGDAAFEAPEVPAAQQAQKEPMPDDAWGRAKWAYKRWLKKWVPLILLVLYSLVGALVFTWLEGDAAEASARELDGHLDVLKRLAKRRLGKVLADTEGFPLKARVDATSAVLEWWVLWASGARWEKLADALRYERKLGLRSSRLGGLRWDVWGALYYVGTIYTTIGYGNIAPQTTGGRVATMIYAVVGIPLVLAILSSTGKFFCQLGNQFWKHLRAGREWARRKGAEWRGEEKAEEEGEEGASEGSEKSFSPSQEHRETMPVLIAVSMCLGWMCVCAGVFCIWERDWTYFQSFYFFFVSLSTIGLGDVVPAHPRMLIFAFAFVIIGLSLVSMTINVIQMKIEEWLFHVQQMMKQELARALAMGDSPERDAILAKIMKKQPWYMRNLMTAVVSEKQTEALGASVEAARETLTKTFSNSRACQTELSADPSPDPASRSSQPVVDASSQTHPRPPSHNGPLTMDDATSITDIPHASTFVSDLPLGSAASVAGTSPPLSSLPSEDVPAEAPTPLLPPPAPSFDRATSTSLLLLPTAPSIAREDRCTSTSPLPPFAKPRPEAAERGTSTTPPPARAQLDCDTQTAFPEPESESVGVEAEPELESVGLGAQEWPQSEAGTSTSPVPLSADSTTSPTPLQQSEAGTSTSPTPSLASMGTSMSGLQRGSEMATSTGPAVVVADSGTSTSRTTTESRTTSPLLLPSHSLGAQTDSQTFADSSAQTPRASQGLHRQAAIEIPGAATEEEATQAPSPPPPGAEPSPPTSAPPAPHGPGSSAQTQTEADCADAESQTKDSFLKIANRLDALKMNRTKSLAVMTVPKKKEASGTTGPGASKVGPKVGPAAVGGRAPPLRPPPAPSAADKRPSPIGEEDEDQSSSPELPKK